MQRQLANIAQRHKKGNDPKANEKAGKLLKHMEEYIYISDFILKGKLPPLLTRKSSLQKMASFFRSDSNKDMKSIQIRSRSHSFSEKSSENINTASARKILYIIDLLRMLAAIEIEAGRFLNLDFTLELKSELNLIAQMLDDKTKFTEADLDTLKKMMTSDSDTNKTYPNEILQIFFRAAMQNYSTRNLFDVAHNIYAIYQLNKRSAMKYLTNDLPLLETTMKEILSTESKQTNDSRVTLQKRLSQLLELIGRRDKLSFSPFFLKHDANKPGLSQTKSQKNLLEKDSKDKKVRLFSLRPKKNVAQIHQDRFNIYQDSLVLKIRYVKSLHTIYNNFSLYEKIITKSIAILKSPEFQQLKLKRPNFENLLFGLIHNSLTMIQASIEKLSSLQPELLTLKGEYEELLERKNLELEKQNNKKAQNNLKDEFFTPKLSNEIEELQKALDQLKELQTILDELGDFISYNKKLMRLVDIVREKIPFADIIHANEGRESLVRGVMEAVEQLNSTLENNNNNNSRFELKNCQGTDRVGNLPLMSLRYDDMALALREHRPYIGAFKYTTSPHHIRLLETTLGAKGEPSLSTLYAVIPCGEDPHTGIDYRDFEISEWIDSEELKDRFERLFKQNDDNNNNALPPEGMQKKHYENFLYFAEKIITFILNLDDEGLWIADMKPENLLVRNEDGEVIASDLKSSENISLLKDGQPYMPKGFIEFTTGYWSDKSIKTEQGKQIIYVNHNILEALIFTFYSLVSFEPYQRIASRDVKIKQVKEGLDKKKYLKDGDLLADVIREVFNKLLAAEQLEVTQLSHAEFRACLLNIQGILRASIKEHEITVEKILQDSPPSKDKFKKQFSRAEVGLTKQKRT